MLNALTLHPPRYLRLLERLDRLLAQRRTSGIEHLRALDDATLRDIGVDRSEFESIESEALGCAGLTRRRVRAGAGQG